jgi:NAD(P)-dependent dehydrogenase (short-subunit alcohol dehydrogenase family)
MTTRKAIFITGAASGIGLASARRFAREGWLVGLSDIDEAGLARAAAEIGADDASVHPLDVRDREAWTPALQAFTARSGGP